MQIIIHLIIPLLIPVALGILLSNIYNFNRKEAINNLTKEHIVIKLPKAYLLIGCVDISFFVICIFLMSYFPNSTAKPWVRVLFSVFALLGVAIVLETQIWKIEVFRQKDYFLCRALPFRTCKIQYSNCEYFKYTTNSLVLKANKKTFYIDCKAINFEFLLSMLIQHKVKEFK